MFLNMTPFFSFTDKNRPNGFPFINIHPTPKSVEKGADATLICSASGTPEPTIYWYKNFRRLKIDKDHVSMTPKGMNTLKNVAFKVIYR